MINLRKVADTLLYSGTVVYGNLNDFTNLVYKICPDLPTDSFQEIINKLEEKGVKDGDNLEVFFSNQPLEDVILSYRINNMNLNFKNV